MAESLSGLVNQATRAVAGISDKQLRLKAFEVVLQNLLQGGKERSAVQGDKVYTKDSRRLSPVTRGSLPHRLLELADDGFFKTPRSSAEVREEMQRRGHHYSENSVRMALLRLVRKRVLRRVPKTRGKKPVYSYVAN